MKYDAFSKHQFKGVYWDYLSEQDTTTGQMERRYQPVKEIKFTLMPKDDELEIYADEELRTLSRITDIQGRNYVHTNTVSHVPQTVQVESATPVKDALNNVVGYQHKVTNAQRPDTGPS